MILDTYNQIFDKYNVKILHQYLEWIPRSILCSIALDNNEATMIWNHWSIDRFLVSSNLFANPHIIFSWGELSNHFIYAQNYNYKYLIKTGHVGSVSHSSKSRVEEIKSFFPKNVDFIISLFDNTHDRVYQGSTDSMIFFYSQILKEIEKNNSWAALIKPKGYYFDKLPYSDSLHGIIEKLKKQNRCLILGSSDSISDATTCGDLSVCYEIGSVGIISGFYGNNALHWDLPGNLDHPLHKLDIKNKIVFTESNELIKALKAASAGEIEYGHHNKKILSLFNEFSDNNGSKRVSKFIYDFIAQIDKGLNLSDALTISTNNYSKKWGIDSVKKYSKKNDIKLKFWNEALSNFK